MSKKFILLLLLLLCALVIYTKIKIINQNNISAITTLPSPKLIQQAESSLTFSPDAVTTNDGESKEVNIRIDSHGKYPTLIQLELAYDATILTGVALSPGTYFANPNILLNNNDEKTGRISYAISLPPGANPSFFSGTAAIVKFTVRKNTLQRQTLMYFLPKTAIRALSTNIPLKITYGIKILINPSTSTSTSPTLR
jgi:hypothetical protein